MLCISHDNTNPAFNLAAEEYVLKNFTENCFMLWRNENAIIVGQHQNTLAEINVEYVKEKNITVIRRLSGGGAVFHDLGNLNFTFIMNSVDGKEKVADFSEYTVPVLEVLLQLGVDARFEGRNDLTIEGKKFSGNAEHIWKNRILRHGTLLFSSVMNDLHLALKVNPLKFQDKAVKSVRSRVTNISEHLKEELDVLHFRDILMTHVMKKFEGSRRYSFTDEDIRNINRLVETKYGTWEWNFGHSPKYGMQKAFRGNGGFVEIHMNVNRGIINDIRIYGDFFNKHDVRQVEEILKGSHHNEAEIRGKLASIDFNGYFHNISVDEFVDAMF
jgi:lipoate---protein ligase